MQAIILAGGKGTRLMPYTLVFPKPMLPVGGVPIIETIVKQLAFYGCKDIIISLGYLGKLIELYFKDKSKVPSGVKIRYCWEREPLGTSGALGLIDGLDDNFIAINGDILSTLDFKAFFDYHVSKNSIMSIAVGKKEVKMNLGITKLDKNNMVTGIDEKPTYSFDDNMGMYIYNKKVLKYIKKNERLDVNVLVEKLISNKEPVYGYRSSSSFYWIDIGQHADFEKANKEFEQKKDEFLKN